MGGHFTQSSSKIVARRPQSPLTNTEFHVPKSILNGATPVSDTPSKDEQNAPIEIVSYDPSWPGKFNSERELLQEVLRPWITAEIEHVGSTAVTGLASKPVIDIMVPVQSLDASRGAIQAAMSIGYIYWPYKPDVMHWFCKPSAAHRTHHLHLVPYKSPLWNDRIRFRDTLRQDLSVAAEYVRLKVNLGAKYRNDREAYPEGKTEFVNNLLQGTLARNQPG